MMESRSDEQLEVVIADADKESVFSLFEDEIYPRMCDKARRLGQMARESGLPRVCNLVEEYITPSGGILKVYLQRWLQGYDAAAADLDDQSLSDMKTYPKRYLIGRNRQAELLVEPKSDDPNHFNFYCVNGDWDGNFKQGLVTSIEAKIEQKGYEILASDNSGEYHEVFLRYREGNNEILEEKKLIYQNKTKSQIELEIKKLQEKHTVMKSAKDILQEIGYPSNSQIECYIGYAEAKMRDMKNAIELG